MVFGLSALAGVSAGLGKYIGKNAPELFESLGDTLESKMSSMEKMARFAPLAGGITRNIPRTVSTIGGRMAVGGLGGYALGTGIDWMTNDNRWAGRLGTVGMVGGASLGVRGLSGKFNSAFEYLTNGIKGAHSETTINNAARRVHGMI